MNKQIATINTSIRNRANLSWTAAIVALVAIVVGVAWPTSLAAQNQPSLDLSSLSVTDQNGATVSIGAFDPATATYSGSVDSTVESINVHAIASAGSSANVQTIPRDSQPGTSGHQVELSHGTNLILVSVDSSSIDAVLKTYAVQIIRGGAAASGTANVVSINGGEYRAREGSTVPFLLTRTGDTTQELTVQIEISEWINDKVPTSSEGRFDVEFEAGHASARHDVETIGDSLSRGISNVEGRVWSGSGYTVGTNSGTLVWQVWDDDYGKMNLESIVVNDMASSHVDIGTFDSAQKSYSATVASTVEYVTVSAPRPTFRAWGTFILPGDSKPDISGHQVALSHGTNLIVVGVYSVLSGETELINAYELEIERPGTATAGSPTNIGVSVPSVGREGAMLPFLLTRTGDTSQSLTVQFDVTETGGDLVSGLHEGQKEVEFLAGEAFAKHYIGTMADEVWEEHSTVKVEVTEGTGYEVSQSAGSASTLVEDNDLPDMTAALTLDSTEADEGDQITATITVTTEGPQIPHEHAGQLVIKTYSGTAGEDDFELNGSVIALLALHAQGAFKPVETDGNTTAFQAKTSVTIELLDDERAEPDETFQVSMEDYVHLRTDAVTIDPDNKVHTVTIRGEDETPPVPDEAGYATVVVTDSGTTGSAFTISWHDPAGCDSDYSARLKGGFVEFPMVAVGIDPNGWDSSGMIVYQDIGSTSSENTEIVGTLEYISTTVYVEYEYFEGYVHTDGLSVTVHCDGSHFVAEVPLPSQAAGSVERPKPGTYSSEAPLTGLTISSGTLSPAFNKDGFLYSVLDVPNADEQVTFTATAKSGYSISWDPVTDADPDTDGHQVDIEVGYYTIYVTADHYEGIQGFVYEVIVKRAEETTLNSPATGGPTVSGTAQVGETLTADTSGIADADGLTNVSYSYQWIRNDGSTDTEITSATDSTYTLVAADEGQTIKVKVSFADDADNGETLTSTGTVSPAVQPRTANSPPTGVPAVTGTAQVGETLTADTSGIADDNGLSGVTFSYQWTSNDGISDTDITGETDSTYTLVAADEGNTIKVRVSFTDDDGYTESLTSDATEPVSFAVQQQVANSPPTGAPTISGTAQVGETLTADITSIADDDGLNNVSYGYQWVANDGSSNTDIADATDSTYTLVAADEGKTIKVHVSFTDDADNEETLTSAATATVEAAPQPDSPATGLPTISGTVQVGETLTADTSGIADDDGLDNAAFRYQWLADAADVTGATASTYSLVAADAGKTIKVRVSFTDDRGNPESLTSAATDPVEAAAAPEPPAMPTGLSTAVSHDAVTLTWDDPQDDAITGYVILRRDRAIHPIGTFVTIAGDTGSADTTYTDAAVEPEKLYNYKIQAINEHGEVSERSDWVRGNTPAVPVPDKPTGLSTAVSHDAVTLTWDDPQDDSITGYAILRRDRAIHPIGTFVTIAGDTGSADTTYTDDTVEPEKKYVYRIKAINEHGEVSERSDWVRGNTPAAPQSDSPATGEPTITGTVQVGQTLSVDTSGIADADGLDNAVFAYQWVANDGTTDTDIPDAMDAAYTLVDDDAGQTIKVRVTFTDDDGNPETLTSAATDEVDFAVQEQGASNNPVTGLPTISGTAQVGEMLTVDTTGIADADGLTNAVLAYQWLSDDAEIGGATGATYTPVADDAGRTIKVRVTFTDDNGNPETLTSAATGAVEAAPQPDSPATGEPTISGTAQVGETLTVETTGIADADGLNSAVFAYQWLSDDAEIGGATGSTYTLLAGDEGQTIKVRVTIIDDAGNETTLTSAATDTVGFAVQQQGASNTPATGEPTITGTAQVGETLTAGTSGVADDDGLTTSTFSYQWVASDGTADVDILGATDSTYTVAAADEGNTIKVRVSFTDDAGNQESLTSGATERVDFAVQQQVDDTSDTDAPTISSIAITSDPDEGYNRYCFGGTCYLLSPGFSSDFLSGVYGIGDIIKATVTFNEDVTVTGNPRIHLDIGGNSKPAEYDGGEGRTVVFAYTVAEGDLDADGIAISTNGLTLMVGSIKDAAANQADLSHDALPDQIDHRVDGIRPIVSRIDLKTGPNIHFGSDRIFSPGELLFIDVRFSEIVGFSGNPQLILDFDGEAKRADWSGWMSSHLYEIQEGDLDNDGVAVGANAIDLNGGYIKDSAGNDAVLTHPGVADAHGIKVDGVLPFVSSIAITSDPGNDESYSAGDIIEVTVTFSENVLGAGPQFYGPESSGAEVSGTPKPHLELNIGGEARTATYQGNGRENAKWVFEYSVRAGDSDDDGIAIDANNLSLPNAYITDVAGNRLPWGGVLAHDALPDDSGHKVYGEPSALTLSGETTVNYRENGQDPVADYTAGSQGANIAWDLSGDDKDHFSILISYNPRRVRLAFNSSPNYEDPTDADSDNRYEVTIHASDGTNAGILRVTVVVVNKLLDNDEVPVIVGTAQVGETLTIDTHLLSHPGPYFYKWLRNDGNTDEIISGAYDSSYTLTEADEGKRIKVRLSPHGSPWRRLTSEPTAVVAPKIPLPGNSPATGAPVIRGTAQVDETLTADTSGITDADGLTHVSFSYRWIRNDGATASNIFGATGATYTLTTADQGKTIRVRVSFSDDTGNTETLTSEATAPVTFNPNSPEPGLTSMSVSSGALSPTFHSRTMEYTVPDVPNEIGRITLTTTAKTDYTVVVVRDAVSAGGVCPGYGQLCTFSYHDDFGNRVDALTDADTNTPGFQVDLDEGENVFAIHVYPPNGIGDLYKLTVNRAVGTPAVNTPATGAPTIDGTAQVGETLTADTSGIADADRLTNVSYSYQWLTNNGTADTDITGATDSTYTVAAADEGKTIKVRVSFTDDAGNEETLTSAATDTVSFAVQQQVVNTPATGQPTISGTVQVGETLTADTSGIADADGLTSVAYRYQWLADGADIAGATAGTYTLVDADEGAAVKVRVSFTDDAGNEETLTSAATDTVSFAVQQQVVNTPATGQPTISGTVQVGETLTADTSGIADQDGLGSAVYSYQWLADDADIAGATVGTYTLVDADEGAIIKVRVSFTDDADHEETLTSVATDVVEARPNSPATGQPTISGTAQVGETLTADTSGIADQDGLGSAVYGYQWLADDADIAGATVGTYTLVDADEGAGIKVRVSFTDDAGHEETMTSAATVSVAAAESAEPPAPPTGLTAAVSHDQVVLSWDDPQDDSITGYVILRRNRATTDPGEFTELVADTGSAATTYTDHGVAAETLYTYRIKAINEHGVSELSRWVRADTPAPPVPAKPTGLTAAPSHDQVVLSWDDPQDDSITGYVILRRNRATTGQGEFTELVADTGSAATTYTDHGVEAETSYTYRIRAINEHGVSELSRWARADTPAPSPANSLATGAPTISGMAQGGETLTSGTSGISDVDGLSSVSYSY